MKNFQQGFSIITAIFLLVVLSFLGVAMVSLSTSQNQSSAMDVMGSRAYQAARAGVEWAVYQVAQTAPGTQWAGCAAPAATFAAGELGSTLSPFTVTVNCTAPTAYVEGTTTTWIYSVNVVANTGGVAGDPNYIERVIDVTLGN